MMPSTELHRDNRACFKSANDLLVSVDGHRELATAQEAHLAAELAGLRRRLQTQPLIEQSKGLLMGYYGIDADSAFALLKVVPKQQHQITRYQQHPGHRRDQPTSWRRRTDSDPSPNHPAPRAQLQERPYGSQPIGLTERC
jgi:ANTAR domain